MKNNIILLFALFPIFLFSQRNFTGTWTCDDGGTYYLHQLGNDLWWHGDGGTKWQNVFHGKIHGDNIYGDWSDVPSGELRNFGSLTLEIVSNNKLRRVWSTNGFGNIWTRGKTPATTQSTNFWEFVQHNNGWNGTWTQRGNSNIYDGKLRNGSKTVTTIVKIKIVGKNVTVTRTSSSNNILVTYKGAIQNDGKMVKGNWTYSGGSGTWSGWIGGR